MKFTMDQIKAEIAPKPKNIEVSDIEIIKKLEEITETLQDQNIMPPNIKIGTALIQFLAETKLGIREKGLFLVGDVGTGKTVALKIINNARGYDFLKSHKITEDSKSHEHSSQFIKELLRRYSGDTNKNIIIDDLGDELTMNNYGIKSEFMSEVIRYRHETFLSRGDLTLISSNMSQAKFIDRYGERIYSRIKQMCEVVVCNGDDLRVKK